MSSVELSADYTSWSSVAKIGKNGPTIFQKYLMQACHPIVEITGSTRFLKKVDPRVVIGKALYGGDIVKIRLFKNAAAVANESEMLNNLGTRINEASDALNSCDRQSQPEKYVEQINILAKIYKEEILKLDDTNIVLLSHYLKNIPFENRKDYAIIDINRELFDEYQLHK